MLKICLRNGYDNYMIFFWLKSSRQSEKILYKIIIVKFGHDVVGPTCGLAISQPADIPDKISFFRVPTSFEIALTNICNSCMFIQTDLSNK